MLFRSKDRAKILKEIAGIILDNLQLLAELETRETGKPLKESLFVDIPLAADCFNYYAHFLETLEEEAIATDSGIDLIKYESYGVCGVYLPYNVPLMIFGFSCAAALAAGNAIIVKPSEYGSLSLLELARHFDDLDIPRGLINIITGKGATIGKNLAQSDINLISFTGSRRTLRKIILSSAKHPKKIICELGGANLTVVFSDANKESALQNILGSAFMKQGQACIGTSLAVIEENIYDDFVSDLVKRTEKIKIGDPFDPTVGIGSLASRAHLESVQELVKDLENQGARILCGGVPLNEKGYFYLPTIMEIENIIYKELFAPVILVKKFKPDEIVEIIENNPRGLVLQIWSNDFKKAGYLAQYAAYGTVWINTFAQMSPQTPFGGMKNSGWGRNLGKRGFFEYVQTKHIGIGQKKSPVEGWFGV